MMGIMENLKSSDGNVFEYGGQVVGPAAMKNHIAAGCPLSDHVDLSLNDEVFSLYCDLIYRTAGIKLSSQKKGLNRVEACQKA